MTSDGDTTAPGTKRLIDGQWRVFYDGYWIKAYDAPALRVRPRSGSPR